MRVPWGLKFTGGVEASGDSTWIQTLRGMIVGGLVDSEGSLDTWVSEGHSGSFLCSEQRRSESAEASFTLSPQNRLQWATGALVGARGNLISQGHHSSVFDLGQIRTWLFWEPGHPNPRTVTKWGKTRDRVCAEAQTGGLSPQMKRGIHL